MADEYTQLMKERETHVKAIAKIDAQLEPLKAARLKEILDEAASLGWQPTKTRKLAKGEKREPKLGTPCGVCEFATEPYHDGRLKAHRDQGENKKPFTDSQLEKLGLKKIKTAA